MKKFIWGEVIKRHDFFGLEIIEYYDRITKGCTVTKEIDYDTILFHVEYPNGMNESYPSLDIAVIGILVKKYQGLNSHLTYPIARMLEIK